MSVQVDTSATVESPLQTLQTRTPEFLINDYSKDPVSDSNSAYSGDEESELEIHTNRKKKIVKRPISNCSDDGKQLNDSSKQNANETSDGRYVRFEKMANGLDGYFDESSDSDELGANEDNSFNFEMCRVRRSRGHRTSGAISPNGDKMSSGESGDNEHARPHATARSKLNDHITSNLLADSESLEIDDALCVISEGFAQAPPLALEDDFDELDI